MGTNKLALAGLAILAIVVVVVVINRANAPETPSTKPTASPVDSATAAVKQDTKPISTKADGDTVNETLRTVKASYEKTQTENSTIKDEVSNTKKEVAELKRQLASATELLKQKTDYVAKSAGVGQATPAVDPNAAASAQLKSEWDEQLAEGKKQFAEIGETFSPKSKTNKKSRDRDADSDGFNGYAQSPDQKALNGYEVTEESLGLGGSDVTKMNKEQREAYQAAMRSHLPGYVKVKAMTQGGDSGSSLLDKAQLNRVGDAISKAASDAGLGGSSTGATIKNTLADTESSLNPESGGKGKGGKVTPYYTVPAHATLYEAVSMTALIGTVPVGGKVNDPFPVKMIIGDDNLATNGLRIPGLKGIVFEGVARGNWNLSCVSVSLTGATFTFNDGTIQHLGTDKEQNNNEKVSSASSPYSEGDGGKSIGYITDKQGVPCIAGKRVTDADKQLFTLATLGAAKSYFDAKAAAETTTSRAGILGSDTSVTGDKGKFINNTTYANSVGLVMDFYNKRMRDTFDAIVADPATPVVLNITKDLLVDHNTANRKLVYNVGGRHANAMD